MAIKVLPSNLSKNEEVRQRLEREAKTISQLSHRHICAPYDVGSQDGVDYLAMEYLEGETLSERLMKRPLPLEQTLLFGKQVSAAGGYEPRWRRDGKEIFHLAADRKLMAVPVQAEGSTFQMGTATALFDAPLLGFLQGWENFSRYDVTADGQRFLVNVPIQGTASPPLVIVLNWTASLKKSMLFRISDLGSRISDLR